MLFFGGYHQDRNMFQEGAEVKWRLFMKMMYQKLYSKDHYLLINNTSWKRGLQLDSGLVACWTKGKILLLLVSLALNAIVHAMDLQRLIWVMLQENSLEQRMLSEQSRLDNYWFPLIRPTIKPLFLRGVTLGGGSWLISHKIIDQPFARHENGMGCNFLHALRFFNGISNDFGKAAKLKKWSFDCPWVWDTPNVW